MRAAVIDQYGDLDVLSVRDVPRPAVGVDEVLVQVHCAAVNPIDTKLRDGTMRFRYGRRFPMTVGYDMCGTITEVGSAVTNRRVGEIVYGRGDRKTGESCAEFCAVGADAVALKPHDIGDDEAAAMPLAALTALQALRDDASLQTGDRVLIIGASGGVGTYAVQIARAMGASVTAVCSAANVDLVSELGAGDVIDYTSQPTFRVGGEPFDVILDAVGAESFTAARDSLTDNGTYVSTTPSARTLLGFLTNRFTRRTAVFAMVKPRGTDLDELSEWVQDGRLRSIIDSSFELDEIAEAHRRSETKRARGKIVIRVSEALD